MKFSIITISFLLTILFFTHMTQQAACPTALPARYHHIKPGKVVAAYFAGWDIYRKNAYTVEDIYPIAHKLTHIIYAFAKPNAQDGTCDLQDPLVDIGASVENHQTLSGCFAGLLKLKAKFPHLKILLSIGGGADSKQISQIVQQGFLKKFVASCVVLLDQCEYRFKNPESGQDEMVRFNYENLFDGIDLDWEWSNNIVPESEAAAYADMMLLFRTLLNKRGAKQKRPQLLTSALQVSASVYNTLPLKKVVAVVDWFNLMAYDFAGAYNRGIGFNAPICNPWSKYSIDNAVHGVINLGISPDKLILGIPLYGQLFDQTNGMIGAPFERTSLTGALSYSKIKEQYLHNNTCEYKWHSSASVPYLYCAHDKVFISFDDELSIKEKVKYARKNRFKGVALWRLAHDDDEHSLVNAI